MAIVLLMIVIITMTAAYVHMRKARVCVHVVKDYVSCEGMYVDMDARDAYMQDMRKEMR